MGYYMLDTKSISIEVNALFNKVIKNLCVLWFNDMWDEHFGVKETLRFVQLYYFDTKLIFVWSLLHFQYKVMVAAENPKNEPKPAL